MEKLDLHCHILPGLDDGPGSGEESLEMLKTAYEQEIYRVIATSHGSGRFPQSCPAVIRRACQDLERSAQEAISPLIKIYPGQEILYTDSVLEKLSREEFLTLADSSYVLLEFFPGAPYSMILRAVREFAMTQYDPILAHVERYQELKKEGRVEALIEAGAYMQLNYRSIQGRWYDPSVRWCREMLRRENIHFLGTDMHNRRDRAPETRAVERWLVRHLDDAYLEKICRKNAEKVIENGRIRI